MKLTMEDTKQGIVNAFPVWQHCLGSRDYSAHRNMFHLSGYEIAEGRLFDVEIKISCITQPVTGRKIMNVSRKRL